VNGIDYTGLNYLKGSLMSSEYLKEINLKCKFENNEGNCISDEGCFLLNEILKKSKIERINLEGKYYIHKI
jgi:hypothetical protein